MKKILLLEDETLVQMLIEDFINDLGYEVHAVSSLVRAVEAYTSESFDGAVLDVNLGDGTNSFPLAALLQRDGCGFVFMSGYNPEGIEGFAQFPEIEKLSKPIVFNHLKDALARMCGDD